MESSSSYQYPNNNNYYGYPPSSHVYGQYPPQQQQLHTPLPQRVSSIASEYANNSMIDSSTPPAVNPMYSMPTPNYQQQQQQQQESVYPPVQYRHHQRNYSEGTASPPGSPPRFPQVQPYQTITGYPDATQELITSSYRPAFVQNVSDSSTNVSTPNGTPPATNPGFRPSTSQPSYNQQQYQQQQHRRTPSSLRSNVIMTIERPKYTYLPESENAEDGEVPFIPVSPDTDSDEEYFVKPTQPHRVNEYSTDDYNNTPPVQQHQHQHQQQQPEPVVNNKNNVTYNDPTQFYMYPPHPVADIPPPSVQVPIIAQTEVQNQAPELPRHQEPVRPVVPARVIEPNYGLLSILSTSFIRHVKGLENVRELWCASEYNESFTGSEAVIIIKGLLNDQVPEEYCVNIANALMRCKPALFSPTQYSQRSLISNTMYNSDDTYFLEEDISDDNLPVGVIPSLTPCYSYVCKPGQGGCYSDRCPNNGKDFVSDNKVEVTVSRNASYKSTSSPVGGWVSKDIYIHII